MNNISFRGTTTHITRFRIQELPIQSPHRYILHRFDNSKMLLERETAEWVVLILLGLGLAVRLRLATNNLRRLRDRGYNIARIDLDRLEIWN